MKTKFYAVVPMNPGTGGELAAGALVATVETPDGVDVDRALNAIARGLATSNPPAAKPDADKVTEGQTQETRGNGDKGTRR